MKLENVAITNALQLEAARRHAVPIRINFVAHVEFEVAQPIRCRLIAFYCSYVTLRCDLKLQPLRPLTLKICSMPAMSWLNSVPNFSAIEQSAAELLRFEYLTI